MASALHWIPDSLYNYSIAAVVGSYSAYQNDLRTCHGDLLFDVYYKVYKEGLLTQLGIEFGNLHIFKRLLKVPDKRCLLHNCFQALMDHGCRTASELAYAYKHHCSSVYELPFTKKDDIVELGFSLGSFLIDAGWLPESEVVLSSCLELCYTYNSPYSLPIILECHLRLLRVRNLYCEFEEGKETLFKAQECIERIKSMDIKVNFASIYCEISSFYFVQSIYKEAYRWSLEALRELNSSLYPREIINVLRQAAKACVITREYKRAGMLIKQALHLVRETFGNRGLVTADTLSDYGFYLLNVDSVGHSIKVYQSALDLRACVFGGKNLFVALAHGDLAYASYVYEYSSGRFKDARDHADKALTIMNYLLDEEHFLLASARRVKALILEEIAIDSHDKDALRDLLTEAQELHASALTLTKNCFGEFNILTAKHYGNLGRLFQTMGRYEFARFMYLKAIEVKERILGPNDYEVALTIGHLASLYNYDMKLYEEAETLYLRSIEIGIQLYGEGYSRLVYDYRGLLRVYTKLGYSSKATNIRTILRNWQILRNQTDEFEKETCPLTLDVQPIAPEDMLSTFNCVQ